MHFLNSFISLKIFCERLQDPPLTSKLTKQVFITNHMTLKPSIRSSSRKQNLKIHCQVSYSWIILLPLPATPLTLSLRLLMFRSVAEVQATTQYRKKLKYYLFKQLLTEQNMRKHVHFSQNQHACTYLAVHQLQNLVVSN